MAALLAAGCTSAATAGAAAAKPSASASPMASCGSMPGMTMPACPTGSAAAAAAEAAASAGGVNPIPTQVLGTADWQGMKITAEAMTAVPFLIYNGTSMQEVKPPKNVSFHLMVLLNDAQTGVVIPYASVWATITERLRRPTSTRACGR